MHVSLTTYFLHAVSCLKNAFKANNEAKKLQDLISNLKNVVVFYQQFNTCFLTALSRQYLQTLSLDKIAFRLFLLILSFPVALTQGKHTFAFILRLSWPMASRKYNAPTCALTEHCKLAKKTNNKIKIKTTRPHL